MNKLERARKALNNHFPLHLRFFCYDGMRITIQEFYNTAEGK